MIISNIFPCVACLSVLVGSVAMAQDCTDQQLLVQRVVPFLKGRIEFSLNPALTKRFMVDAENGNVKISAGETKNLAPALGYYLRHGCGSHWSWNGNRMEMKLPLSKFHAEIQAPWAWRYAYNYCTLSYTCAFWGTREWEQEIDRMALNGMTHMLVQAGLEKVWQLTLRELGYPEDRIRAFIPNPASAAWWNMGNLEGLGGPLSQGEIDREGELGRFIVQRMVSLGIQPVLQGFVGLLPHDFDKYYKGTDARYFPQGKWVSGFQRPTVIDPTTKDYTRIAEVWYRNLERVYGLKAKAFGGDLFHEGGNSKGVDLASVAGAVQNSMQKASPGSVWVLQHWGSNPSPTLLSGLDDDKAVVVSLANRLETATDGSTIRSFCGKSWVWCELSNFGGKHALYGSLKALAHLGDLQKSPEKERLLGVGTISEGLETNPIFYDLLFDRFWTDRQKNMSDEELKLWIAAYVQRRYGAASEDASQAWNILERSVYTPVSGQTDCLESILCARPGRHVDRASSWASGRPYYQPKEVQEAALLMLKAGESISALWGQETFRYDVVDVVRQFLADIARPLLAAAMDAWEKKDEAAFNQYAGDFLGLIAATDELCGTHPMWRLGRACEMARAKGKTPEEKKGMEIACKRLYTTWSGKIDALNDYAHRQLQGLLKDYYLTRWNIFFTAHRDALAGKLPEQDVMSTVARQLNEFEPAWAANDTPYSSKPEGDTKSVAYDIMNRFMPVAASVSSWNQIGRQWKLDPQTGVLEFNVSDSIQELGTYAATFVWRNGNNALSISKVCLFEGDKPVSGDVHAGYTGVKNEANTYIIRIDKLRTNLDVYKLKAEVEGVGGGDSSGVLLFRKIK